MRVVTFVVPGTFALPMKFFKVIYFIRAGWKSFFKNVFIKIVLCLTCYIYIH